MVLCAERVPLIRQLIRTHTCWPRLKVLVKRQHVCVILKSENLASFSDKKDMTDNDKLKELQRQLVVSRNELKNLRWVSFRRNIWKGCFLHHFNTYCCGNSYWNPQLSHRISPSWYRNTFLKLWDLIKILFLQATTAIHCGNSIWVVRFWWTPTLGSDPLSESESVCSLVRSGFSKTKSINLIHFCSGALVFSVVHTLWTRNCTIDPSISHWDTHHTGGWRNPMPLW